MDKTLAALSLRAIRHQRYPTRVKMTQIRLLYDLRPTNWKVQNKPTQPNLRDSGLEFHAGV